MKTSLFKKEITKTKAGIVKGGGTTYQNTTFDMCRTSRYNLLLGFIADSEFCTDVGTYDDPTLAPPQ